MPYVTQERRLDLDDGLLPQTPGELNFAITSLCLDFLPPRTANYEDYNTIIGVLESAKLEFYRRAVAAYEDRKCAENGDVY